MIGKKIAIMQPYFLPYIGYFQLINAVDEFVIYDNIEYTRKGWINRNRILSNGKDEFITLPLKKDSDYLNIVDRYLSDDWEQNKRKMINKINECYRNAVNFKNTYNLFLEILNFKDLNLFNFITNSLEKILNCLEIKTKLIISSNLNIDHSLKSENKVIEICKTLNAVNYINPIGGVSLYKKENFSKNGISLYFLETHKIEYSQFNNKNFISNLSILDLLMFMDGKYISSELLNNYNLI